MNEFDKALKLDSSIVVYETYVMVIAFLVAEGNWYVDDGQSKFYAKIACSSYVLSDLNEGDIFKIRIRKEQYYLKHSGEIQSRSYIEEVLGGREQDGFYYLGGIDGISSCGILTNKEKNQDGKH